MGGHGACKGMRAVQLGQSSCFTRVCLDIPRALVFALRKRWVLLSPTTSSFLVKCLQARPSQQAR